MIPATVLNRGGFRGGAEGGGGGRAPFFCNRLFFYNNFEELLTSLAQKLFSWFANNKMKANHDKCHLFLSTQESFNIQIANFKIKSSKAKKLLGINLDKSYKFDIHVESIRQKANRKLNALARIANYMKLPNSYECSF